MKNSIIIVAALCLCATWWLVCQREYRHTSIKHVVTPVAPPEKFGKITGKFIFEGEIPETEMLILAGDARFKDAATCAAIGIPSESLVIDYKTRGVQNIFIYLRKIDPETIHPSLKTSKQKSVEFNIVDCRFNPHALFARTDQLIIVKTGYAIAYNLHTLPFKNPLLNLFLAPNVRDDIHLQFEFAESTPVHVKDDIHDWMKANWMALDHPYGAITKEDGSFEINLVPEGEHKFRIWHEKKGWINADDSYRRGFTAQVKAGKTFDLGTIKLNLSDIIN